MIPLLCCLIVLALLIRRSRKRRREFAGRISAKPTYFTEAPGRRVGSRSKEAL